MKSTGPKIIGAVFVVAAIIAVFLPFTLSSHESVIHRPLSIINIRSNPHQGGMFGGGFFYTYNGLGNLPGLFNFLISLIVFALLFTRKLKKSLARLILAAAILSHLLIFLNLLIAPFMLSEPDKLLIGYYLLTLVESGLFILLFRRVNITAQFKDHPDLPDKQV